MSQKTLLQISIAIAAEAEEAVSALLGEILGESASVWHHEETNATTVTVYCPRRSQWSARRKAELIAGLARIRACGLDTGPAKITARTVRREVWVRQRQKERREQVEVPVPWARLKAGEAQEAPWVRKLGVEPQAVQGRR